MPNNFNESVKQVLMKQKDDKNYHENMFKRYKIQQESPSFGIPVKGDTLIFRTEANQKTEISKQLELREAKELERPLGEDQDSE